MKQITIDNRILSFNNGDTILNIAQKNNIEIPTMCYFKEIKPFTSCMLCLVQDMAAKKLLPACSSLAQENMVITTNSEAVTQARKKALELLLSEHIGECEALCHLACPLQLNIPLLLQDVKNKRFENAMNVIRQSLPFPRTIAEICPAYCEKACRRNKHDTSVAIPFIVRFVTEKFSAKDQLFHLNHMKKNTGKVAIVGAGLSGLATAYYLLINGIACTMFEKNEKTGGSIINYFDKQKQIVFKEEINIITELGADIRTGEILGESVSLTQLYTDYDIVIIATGKADEEFHNKTGLTLSEKSNIRDKQIKQTTVNNVFVISDAALTNTSDPDQIPAVSVPGFNAKAVRTVASAKKLCQIIIQYLKKQKISVSARSFNSKLGRLNNEEIKEMLKNAAPLPRINTNNSSQIDNNSICVEADRCLQCSCLEPADCKLRYYAEQYKAKQNAFPAADRKPLERILSTTAGEQDNNKILVYEPGKCIKCGICVFISRNANESFGLSFYKRGYDLRIQVPFSKPINIALTRSAMTCVANCPTGALRYMDYRQNGKLQEK